MKKIVYLFLFISIYSFSQKKDSVNLSNPNATIHTHLYFLQEDSYYPEKAAKTVKGLDQETAIEKVVKIKRVLDGKGLMVDFNKIPNDPNYNDTIGYTSLFKYVPFPERMPGVYVEKVNDNWYYSAETVENIEDIYDDVFPWYVQSLQSVVPDYGHETWIGFQVWQWIGLILIIVFAFLVFGISKKLSFFIIQRLLRYLNNKSSFEIDSVIKKLAHPIALLLAFSFIDKIFPSLQFGLDINTWVFTIINIAITVFWIYVFLKLVKVVMRLYEEFTERTDSKLDDQLVPILNRLLSGLVLILGAFKILYLFGVDTSTLIAGATIGGLAFALASQDTVKNLIGTITIFLDKPFHIGDWIAAGEVVGTVEEVGFRSTRIRAADTTLYQIPNSKLSEMVINNSGVRLFRRYSTTLGLRYDTPPELIQAFVEGIRQIISEHPETRDEGNVVQFSGFGDSALEIMVNVFFKSLAWDVEQASKHKLHMAIVKLAAALGVDFAFPSSTLMIEQFPDKSNLAPKYETNSEIVKERINKIIVDFKNNQKETNS